MADETETAPPDAGTFTVGVFKDLEWARRGLDVLLSRGFTKDVVSVVARRTPDVEGWIEQALGRRAEERALPRIGAVVASGPIVGALDAGDQGLSRLGIAGTMRRVGFQAHDGQIFETLTERGGVLVAVQSESRVSDAIEVLHSYGAGNAAIGAWSGRI